MIVWLAWFGVRKRQFGSTVGMLQGWLSAHVYFGTTLIVIATLHAAFKIGWNVHTLAYVLMLAVIASGFYGVYAYLVCPRVMTDNLGEDTLEMLLIKIADLDKQPMVKKAVKCDMCKDLPHGAACVSACSTGAALRVSPEKFLDYTNAVEA